MVVLHVSGGAPAGRGPRVGGGACPYPSGCGGARRRLSEARLVRGDLRRRRRSRPVGPRVVLAPYVGFCPFEGPCCPALAQGC
jgi:hypothetical protein